jgi:hypothetical protein
MRNFIICTTHQNFFEWSNEDETDGSSDLYRVVYRNIHTEVWWGEKWQLIGPGRRYETVIKRGFDELERISLTEEGKK